MKLNINKACDLSSISVLPPHARRTSVGPTGAETSVFGKIQTAQFRSQQSQQSFSQGVSSQPGMFSQFSQNSLDEIATSEQRFDSQEKENSTRRTSCLPLINHTKEESQLQLPRNSSSYMHKRSANEFRCQTSEQLEHRIGVMETSMNRLGMVLDSIQSDIIQVKRGIKEMSSGTESLWKKLVAHNEAVQLMSSGQENIKASFEGLSKSMSEELRQNSPQEHLKEISTIVSTLPEKIETCIVKLRDDLKKSLMEEIQAVAHSMKAPSQKFAVAASQPEVINNRIALLDLQYLNVEKHGNEQAPSFPKIEMGSWNSVRDKPANKNRINSNQRLNRDLSYVQQETQHKVTVGLEEDSDEGFSCLLNDRGSGSVNYTMDDSKEDIKRMLRKARRRKRKHCNTVIID
ncbi:hypothetical protein DM860_016690 [Cuscuta australis]|uniref:Protein PAIR1 n=1 Tax=Cuscuta australis TaxID=267555 RepID=A0A328DKP6_9ASTE|nr:hypothetical protein DM860_016690 [Cuscuta australis]